MQAFDLVNREISSVKTGKLGFTAGKEEEREQAKAHGKWYLVWDQEFQAIKWTSPFWLNLIQLNNVSPEMSNPEDLAGLAIAWIIVPSSKWWSCNRALCSLIVFIQWQVLVAKEHWAEAEPG